jgi:hypothetical protein
VLKSTAQPDSWSTIVRLSTSHPAGTTPIACQFSPRSVVSSTGLPFATSQRSWSTNSAPLVWTSAGPVQVADRSA